MKKILVIYYSQSGQLKAITDHLVAPMMRKDEAFQVVDYYSIEPKDPKQFPFPWPRQQFFNVFPESFAQLPVAIHPPNDSILQTEYDLVILAYQIWFLSPSIPVNSFLKSEYASKLLANRKVTTVIGCRNMWAMAQQKVKSLVNLAGGKLVGNVAFVDRHLNHISVITIVYWVMGGKKDRKWGVFPLPGVADKDIKGAEKFGTKIAEAVLEKEYSNLQEDIQAMGGASIHDFLIFMDETANKMFAKWSEFILKGKKNRTRKLKAFKYYLVFAIWGISPIVYVLFLVTFPIRWKSRRKKREFYCGI